jgi:hypothetical protein
MQNNRVKTDIAALGSQARTAPEKTREVPPSSRPRERDQTSHTGSRRAHCPWTRQRTDRRPRPWRARCAVWSAAAKARGSFHRPGASVACSRSGAMITPEQHAEIRRLYFGEHWKIGTIAAALGVHHDTVRAAIALDTQTMRRGSCRATIVDPYLPFLRDTLGQYPRLRATRRFEMMRARGYTGSVVQLRRVVHTLRPAATPTVYRRLCTLMGEAQVDWGAFGSDRRRGLRRGAAPALAAAGPPLRDQCDAHGGLRQNAVRPL